MIFVMKKTMMIKGEKMTKFTVHIGNFRDCNKNIRLKFNEYDSVYKTFASNSRRNIQYWNDNLTMAYLKQEEKEEKEFELFRDSFFTYLNNNEYFANNLENLFQQNGVSGSNFHVYYNTEKLAMVRQKLSNALHYLDSALSELNGDIPRSSSAYRQIMEVKNRMQQEHAKLLTYERYLNQVVNGIQNLLEQVSTKNKNVNPNLIKNHGFTFKGTLEHINVHNDDFKMVEDVTQKIQDEQIVVKHEDAKRVSDSVVGNREKFDNNTGFAVNRVSDTFIKEQDMNIETDKDNHKVVSDSNLNTYDAKIDNAAYDRGSVYSSNVFQSSNTIETLDLSEMNETNAGEVKNNSVNISIDNNKEFHVNNNHEINNRDSMVNVEDMPSSNASSNKENQVVDKSISSIEVK